MGNGTKKKAGTRAADLKPGDVIPPPAHERRWLWRDGVKRMMVVQRVSEGHVDKGGLWLYVVVRHPSLYGPTETDSVCDMRPDTLVAVQG